MDMDTTTQPATSLLDLALDDLIKKHHPKKGGKRGSGAGAKSGNGGGSGSGSGSGSGAGRGGKPQKGINAPSSSKGGKRTSASTGKAVSNSGTSKVQLSNLHFKVTHKDILDLFAQVGPVTTASLDFDHAGKFKGSASLVFARAGDSKRAADRYHNVLLDGRPMKVEAIGSSDNSSVPGPRRGGGIAKRTSNSNNSRRVRLSGKGKGKAADGSAPAAATDSSAMDIEL